MGDEPEAEWIEELADASNVLLSASTLNPHERSVCKQLLHRDEPEKLNILTITYRRNADNWHDELLEYIGGEPTRMNTISISEQEGDPASSSPTFPGDSIVESIESPQDLTGLGIQISEFIRAVDEAKWEEGATEFVVCFDSITTMLQFMDVEEVYRFLHVITQNLEAAGATAHYHIHPSALDARTVNTLQTLFDGKIILTDDGIDSVVTV